MSAASILPHHIAGSILSLYAGMAVILWRRKPTVRHQLNPAGRKPVHSVHLPQGYTVKLEPGQDSVLTHIDVDLEFCSQEELEHMMLRLVTSAESLTLTDQEVTAFWTLHKELADRRANQVKR